MAIRSLVFAACLIVFLALQPGILVPDEGRAGGRERFVPVLMYHRVDTATSPGGPGLKVTPGQFARQMDYLARAGYHPVTLDRAVAYLRRGGALEPRPVVITFDDGYEDNYRFAFPVLKKYHFPATIFLVAGAVDKTNYFDRGPVLPMLQWGQIREMAADGIDFESHGARHLHMAGLAPDQAVAELLSSRTILESALGRPVAFFCYPYGSFDQKTRRLARRYYRGAVSTRPGVNRPGADLYALRRLRVNGRIGPADFAALLLGTG
ncbi:MAG TPA: polysaccharide deacetylase family protein [Spirochaetia bacterium]|nr:polysaccharide deacetylase family protein [Spirochaetia bacterium]